MRLHTLQSVASAILFTPVLILSLHLAGAQVMTSTNYQIQSDSINASGGLSSSTNYAIESSMGEVGTGRQSSASYALRAGYQQMQEVYIAIASASSSLTLSPSIPGVTGGVSNGSTTVTVKTDNLSGYELTIKATSNPALQKGADSIPDYSPATANPDYTFNTGAADAHFGYTPDGADVVQRFLDDGSACNTGAGNTAASCWDGLSTTAVPISSASTANHPAGTATVVHFRVRLGGAVAQAPGVYMATTTLTALPL